jgi:hypothetical protein
MTSLVLDTKKRCDSAEEKLDDMALDCQQGPGTVCAYWLFGVGC